MTLHFQKSALVTAVFLLAAAGLSYAMEPPTPEQRARYIQDGSLAARVAAAKEFGNDRAHPGLVREFQIRFDRARRQALGLPDFEDGLSSSASAGQPLIDGQLGSQGIKKVFVLLIDFSDYPASNSPASIQGKLFGAGESGYPYESLNAFYSRSSYGQLDIQGSTLGWYRPAYPRSGVVMNSNGRDNLVREALLYFDGQGHDFSQYDNDHDGRVDYFLVLWTGPNGEWASFWWGYFTSFSKSLILDGKQFYGTGYSWQWESRPYPGTFRPSTAIHETGHALGLPDLYDYDAETGPDGGIGGIDVMDGVWGDHNGFSKMLLGWLTPRVCGSDTHTEYLRPAGGSPDAAIFFPKFSLGDPFTEFFMVQNRSRVGNDINLPTDGLLIFHIDATLDAWGEFVYDNSYTDRKLVRLMEADGLEEIDQDLSADAGDYYVPGKSFSTFTKPNSNTYDGKRTGYLDGILRSNMDFLCRIGYERIWR